MVIGHLVDLKFQISPFAKENWKAIKTINPVCLQYPFIVMVLGLSPGWRTVTWIRLL
jgi:hypothetical protein